MADNKNFLTKEWHEKLLQEFKILKTEKLPWVLSRLKDAFSQWDISESSEYETALAEKDLIEARIRELTDMLENVEIIEEWKKSNEIRYWSKVRLKDDKWKEYDFTMVWWWEVDILNNTLSFSSPMWIAIKWKKKWDIVNVRAPKWKYEVVILDVK